ncbi:MAG: helix-turn-helix transcriptional regulator [Pseudopedobacter sp.]|nr:helix-turn-helix transcriptional regulator [Deinococcales bacterium]
MSPPRVMRYTREDYFPIGEFPLYLNRTPHEGDFGAHDHDFMEIQVVLRGYGMHVTAAGAKKLERGDVIVMRPGVWHAYRDCEKLEVYNCCFGVELLRRELAWCLDDPVLRAVLPSSPHRVEARGGILTRLEPSTLKRCEGQLDLLQLEMVQHPFRHPARKIAQLVLVLDALGSAAQLEETLPEKIPRRAPALVGQATALLESRLAHPWTSEELSQRLGLTPTYFVRIFKTVTGLPPLSYLAALRAERAAELLMRSDLSIEHIALEVGWGSSSYFARRFKEHFGLSAREYRLRFVRPGLDLAPGPRLVPRHPARAMKSE